MKSNVVSVRDVSNGEVIQVPVSKLKFRASVYGILKENGMVVIQIHPRSPKYNFPGGQIELGERIEDCLIREFQEETGLVVKPTRIVSVREDLVNFGGLDSYHSLLIFYEVEKAGGSLGAFTDREDSVEAKFVPIDNSLDNKLQDVFKGIVAS